MTNYSLDKYGNRYVSPADLSPTNVEAANAAGKTDPNAFKVERSGLAVIANGKYQFAFSYYYQDPNNPSQLISGPRSANFVVNLQAPDYTVAVSNLTVTPGLLLYGVKWDALDKSLSTNKWFIDAQIYESLTGSFTGEEYLVWSGTGNSATILVSNTNNRWIRVDTRDQDYHKKSVVYGPFKASDPITVDTVGPSNVTSVSVSSGIDTSGYLGFNAYADISWPAVTGGGIRGYRIRFSNDNGVTYSYVNSPGTGTTYRLGGLAIGSTYKIAVATYDEYNNTSSSYISGTDVTVTGTPSVSSYISGGPFQFGVGVGSVATNKGLYFDASNYWYVNATNSARLKVGGATSNYLLWDGSTFEVDGNVTARGGTFSGNLLMSTTGASIYNGTIDANSNLSGNGFVLNSTGLKVANGTKSVTISASTGTITANGGSIGGWNIADTTINKNNITLDSTGSIQIGATATNSVYLKSSGDYVMWAGNNTPDANAKFRVASDGTLYASNAVIGGYATSSQLTTVDGKATTASTTAQTAATDAFTAKTAANAAKATADAALPSTSFNRDAIVNSINSSSTTTTINGGKLTTGTISAGAVVSDFISAFNIDAAKITTGMMSGRDIEIANDNSSNRFKTSYSRSTGPNGYGPYSVLGVNGIAMVSVNTSGVVSHWYPFISGESDIGVGSPYTYIWRNIRATNGTIVTSDRRAKTDILDADLGLNFINLLRPVKYKKYYEPNAPFLDEDGQPILNEDGSRLVDTSKNYYGTRNHYGFIAQEVKEALDQVGVGSNFSGWALADISDPESQQSLSYDKFIAPMAKAIQELSNMVESLQQEVNTLKGI